MSIRGHLRLSPFKEQSPKRRYSLWLRTALITVVPVVVAATTFFADGIGIFRYFSEDHEVAGKASRLSQFNDEIWRVEPQRDQPTQMLLKAAHQITADSNVKILFPNEIDVQDIGLLVIQRKRPPRSEVVVKYYPGQVMKEADWWWNIDADSITETLILVDAMAATDIDALSENLIDTLEARLVEGKLDPPDVADDVVLAWDSSLDEKVSERKIALADSSSGGLWASRGVGRQGNAQSMHWRTAVMEVLHRNGLEYNGVTYPVFH